MKTTATLLIALAAVATLGLAGCKKPAAASASDAAAAASDAAAAASSAPASQ